MSERRSFPLSRRTLLRGAGAALALPWLEAMARGSKMVAPVRFAALYMPNGVHPEHWTPTAVGRDFVLPATLEPLQPVRDRLLVLSQLWNAAAKGGDGHYVKVAGFLTCTTIAKTLGVDLNANGTSVDQVMAQRAGKDTPFPSLELGIHPVTTGVDKNVGYTRVYGSHIAWGSPTNPLAKETNPRAVYERLFRAAQPVGRASRGSKSAGDKLLLDSVLEDARALRGQLGAADRQRVDEYLSVMRSLEERVERTGAAKSKWKPRVPIDPRREPKDAPDPYPEHVELMLDMMALAFETDSTRVATFLFSNEVSNQNFSFVEGVKSGHHEVSHHQKDAEKLRQYQLINRWHVAQYARLLEKLAARKEGDRTVLDNAMVLFGSGIRDGDKHDPHNLPLLVAGSGGGRLATGQHLQFGPDTPLANLYVALLEAFGTPVERFADSSRKMTEVLA